MGTSKDAKWATVKQLSKIHSAFTESSIRALIREKHNNGFDKMLSKIGKKVLIDVNEFERWIDSHRVSPITAKILANNLTGMEK